jgi:hypothetical protein
MGGMMELQTRPGGWRSVGVGAGFVMALGGLVAAASAGGGSPRPSDEKDKPKLTLKASPSVAFAPARIYLVAELKGGADDYERYYCAGIEWDWGDGTKSESSYDCDPYESGKSEIKRRFAVEHRYRVAGDYRIQFRLKQKDDSVAAVNTTVRVRPGLGGGVGP